MNGERSAGKVFERPLSPGDPAPSLYHQERREPEEHDTHEDAAGDANGISAVR